MENEIWLPVVGYEKNYLVSSFGKIKNLLSENILKPGVGKRGYLIIVLCKDKVCKTYNLHRVVAIAFIKNPQSLPCVNHIDSDRQNPAASNLEWVTHKQNSRHAIEKGRVAAPRKEVSVSQFSLSGDLIATYKTIKEAANINGFDPSYVCAAAKGKHSQCYGFIWKRNSVSITLKKLY